MILLRDDKWLLPSNELNVLLGLLIGMVMIWNWNYLFFTPHHISCQVHSFVAEVQSNNINKQHDNQNQKNGETGGLELSE